MVHGKNRISYWIDRRLTGLAGPDYDATISFGPPFEPEDSQYGKSRLQQGNFIGVRRSYAWGAGDYRIRFAPDGDPEDDGVWFGLWITDRSTDVATWIGSLKCPLLDGKAVMRAPTYSTMEIYGRRIRPIDIPAWHVSIKRPVGDGIKPSWGHTGYSPFEGDVMNSEVRYDRDNDAVHFKTGGTTERQTQERRRHLGVTEGGCVANGRLGHGVSMVSENVRLAHLLLVFARGSET